MTLALFRTCEPEGVVDLAPSLAAQLAPFDIRLATVDRFPTTEGVVYLRPEPSLALAGAHELLQDLLGPQRELVDMYYQPGAWRPHCTMAINVPAMLIDTVVSACRSPEVLGDVRVTRIQVVRYRPATEIAGMLLGPHERSNVRISGERCVSADPARYRLEGTVSLAMTKHERETFLADLHVGIISIPEAGRGPLTVPIWYSYEPGGELRVVTGRTSRKAQLLQHADRFSVCVQTETQPYRYVSVEGPVVGIEPADVERDRRPLARRYLGAQLGDRYIEETREKYVGTVLVRMQPERWLTVDYGKA